MTRLAKLQRRKERKELLETVGIALLIGSITLIALVLMGLNYLALNGIRYF